MYVQFVIFMFTVKASSFYALILFICVLMRCMGGHAALCLLEAAILTPSLSIRLADPETPTKQWAPTLLID